MIETKPRICKVSVKVQDHTGQNISNARVEFIISDTGNQALYDPIEQNYTVALMTELKPVMKVFIQGVEIYSCPVRISETTLMA